ncbi:phosphotransferase, partial [Candidatus Fermentibacterales bacterium]|nr:phosphotransferase [Candidatus Fermentibacterales bacterium]
MLEDIEVWLSEWLGDPGFSLVRLKGDASLRAFYRVRGSGGSSVVMDSGQGDLSSFLDVHDLLRSNGFPVPEILHRNLERQWIVLEDLGDTRLLDLENLERRTAVDQALDLLASMQAALRGAKTAGSVAGKRSFTPSFFMAELEHTILHLFFRLLGVPEDRLRALQAELRKLCSSAAEAPRVFLHRDFHSANLMVTGRGLVMVDFQDAR